MPDPDKSTVDDTVTGAARALRAVILAGEHYRQVVAAHLGLDVSQTQALSYLYSKGDLGQVELGALLGYNTSSITALVDRLERAGIACRVRHPTDRRRSIVRLTERGHLVMRDLDRTFRRAFDHLEPQSLAELTTAMSSIAADLRLGADALADLPPARL
ncbi:DNA-binding transcriptional regulator, MarR family [Nakamurella panacisegetis]|uniref:DNA-binding transcriptional regulator, MarR family n=1 Tax=Nakamurella panacisegetis TaxID=1090615 RepID=A0A1H0L1E0_9ACTN|nr:MarR family winged helix-turn-helix transcriptional regulator [Nakamurella panacisegetis]SDO61800.1 DNA-binding transcriptional regulator, MarR family [Nakamurella panacisegetis]